MSKQEQVFVLPNKFNPIKEENKATSSQKKKTPLKLATHTSRIYLIQPLNYLLIQLNYHNKRKQKKSSIRTRTCPLQNKLNPNKITKIHLSNKILKNNNNIFVQILRWWHKKKKNLV